MIAYSSLFIYLFCFNFKQASVDVADMPDWLQKDMDSALGDCWLKGTEEAFAQLMHLVLEENVSGE